MKRFFVFLAVVAILTSCGKGKDEGGDVRTADTATTSQDVAEERQAPEKKSLEDDFSEFENFVQGYLRPYFDSEGSVTSKTVETGEYFDLYVFAEFADGYPMMAAEYKLVLPEGITVMGSEQSDSTIVTLGSYDVDFMIAFRCLSTRHWLVKYLCKVEEEARGGTIETMAGDNLNFIGFQMCDAKTEIRARGGTASVEIR